MTIETKYNIGYEVWIYPHIYPHIYHETINYKDYDNRNKV